MQTVQQSSATRESAPTKSHIHVAIGAFALTLAALPYICGYLLTPRGSTFLGQIFSIDDYFVYLSWTKQAADGHFWIRNLFTTDPQGALQFNIFFLLAGKLIQLTGQSPETVLQALRFLMAAGTLRVVYALCKLCAPDDIVARVTAFGFAALGSGIGWLYEIKNPDLTLVFPSADSNQPEALTFTSTYYAALTGLGTMLIAASMYCLLKTAIERRTHYAVIAGLCLLILGNAHTYDVIHVAAAWSLFLIAYFAVGRRIDWPLLSRSALAGVIALPSAIDQYYVLHHNSVFYQRALEATTLTPGIVSYVIGYGLVLILAIVGLRSKALPELRTVDNSSTSQAITSLALICWSVAGLTIIYAIRLAFQRKLIMGEDIPLSILAGFGVSALTQNLKSSARTAVATLFVAMTLPSTLLFVARDLTTLSRAHSLLGSIGSPYLSTTERDTIDWIDAHTKATDAFIAPPRLALLIPGFADRAVWAGHWGETPRSADKIGRLSNFCAVYATDASRIRLLRSSMAEYFCYPNDPTHQSLAEMTPAGLTRRYADIASTPPPYLHPVHHNAEYTVFSIDLPPQ